MMKTSLTPWFAKNGEDLQCKRCDWKQEWEHPRAAFRSYEHLFYAHKACFLSTLVLESEHFELPQEYESLAETLPFNREDVRLVSLISAAKTQDLANTAMTAVKEQRCKPTSAFHHDLLFTALENNFVKKVFQFPDF